MSGELELAMIMKNLNSFTHRIESINKDQFLKAKQRESPTPTSYSYENKRPHTSNIFIIPEVRVSELPSSSRPIPPSPIHDVNEYSLK